MFLCICSYQKKFDDRSLQLRVSRGAVRKLFQKIPNMLWAKYSRGTFCRKYAQEVKNLMICTNSLEKLLLEKKRVKCKEQICTEVEYIYYAHSSVYIFCFFLNTNAFPEKYTLADNTKITQHRINQERKWIEYSRYCRCFRENLTNCEVNLT